MHKGKTAASRPVPVPAGDWPAFDFDPATFKAQTPQQAFHTTLSVTLDFKVRASRHTCWLLARTWPGAPKLLGRLLPHGCRACGCGGGHTGQRFCVSMSRRHGPEQDGLAVA
jgi:hypothetical protein